MATTESESATVKSSGPYTDPAEIVNDAKLSRDEKIGILREWHYDAVRLQESAGENMAGGEPDRLRSISNALLAFGVSPARECDPKSAPKPSALRRAHRYIANAINALRPRAKAN